MTQSTRASLRYGSQVKFLMLLNVDWRAYRQGRHALLLYSPNMHVPINPKASIVVT